MQPLLISVLNLSLYLLSYLLLSSRLGFLLCCVWTCWLCRVEYYLQSCLSRHWGRCARCLWQINRCVY